MGCGAAVLELAGHRSASHISWLGAPHAKGLKTLRASSAQPMVSASGRAEPSNLLVCCCIAVLGVVLATHLACVSANPSHLTAKMRERR